MRYTYILIVCFYFFLILPTKAQEASIPSDSTKNTSVNVNSKKEDKRKIDAWIVDTLNNTYTGQLYAIDTTGLILYLPDSIVLESRDSNALVYFSPEEIVRIKLERTGRSLDFLKYGLVAPVIPTIYYTYELTEGLSYSEKLGWSVLLVPVFYVATAAITVPTALLTGTLWRVDIDHTFQDYEFHQIAPALKKYAVHKDFEVNKMNVNPEVKKLNNINSIPSNKNVRLFNPMRASRLSLGIGTFFGAQPLHNDYKKALSGTLSDLSFSTQEKNKQIGFDFSIRLFQKVGFEFGFQDYGGFVSFSDVQQQGEYTAWYDFSYDVTRFYLGGKYVFNPVRRIMANRQQYSLSAGVFSSVLTNSVYITSINSTAPEPFTWNYFPEEDLYSEGFYMRANYTVFFYRFLSLSTNLQYNMGNSFGVNNLEWINNLNNQTEKIPSFRLKNSSLSIGFALNIHLF